MAEQLVVGREPKISDVAIERKSVFVQSLPFAVSAAVDMVNRQKRWLRLAATGTAIAISGSHLVAQFLMGAPNIEVCSVAIRLRPLAGMIQVCLTKCRLSVVPLFTASITTLSAPSLASTRARHHPVKLFKRLRYAALGTRPLFHNHITYQEV